jgi:hypothetical protein
LIGLIPPFANCFFEFIDPQKQYPGFLNGLHLLSGDSLDRLLRDGGLDGMCPLDYPGARIKCVALSYVRSNDASGACLNWGPETITSFGIDEQGTIIEGYMASASQLPDPDPIRKVYLNPITCEMTVDRDTTPPRRFKHPSHFQLAPALVSMMLISQRATTTYSAEMIKSRQQRRYEERHPQCIQTPVTRYYTLDLEPFKPLFDTAGGGKGGWQQAWHRVRAFLRHIKKSGKVVPVKAHTRGNPLKGIIQKDYAVKTNQREENSKS